MSFAIVYKSYAKLNLFLDVLGRRRDNYHNIETIFQTVDLADELSFSEDPSRITVSCSNPSLDIGESNLVHRAAMLLKERTGCTAGARVRLEKRIPIAAGLAGGSGNAAATLVALNQLWSLGLGLAQIHALALELGSDVPYCALGGTMAATGRGEHMTSLPALPKTWFVLVHPSIEVSASRVYNSPLLEYSDEKPFAGRTPSFRRAIACLQRGDWPQAVFNRMEGPVFADHPHLAELKNDLIDLGCIAAAMSGSGPTLFGVCKSRRQAQSIAEKMTKCPASIAASATTGLERA